MTEQIEIKGKITKGAAGYWNIMSKDNKLESMRGTTATFKLIAIEEVKETPGATVTETKKVA